MNFKKRVNGSWTNTPHYIHKTGSDTFTTLPAVIYPTGTTATVGLKGQTVQSSIPSPTSPIQPQGTGELERNVAIIDNRSDTINNSYYKDIRLTDELPAGTYTISFTMNSKTGNSYSSSLGRGNTTTYQADVSEYAITNIPANISRTITLNSNACIWARFLRSATPATFSYNVSKIAIVSGDKPYGQYKIPILSADTTTPVYLGEVQTTRRIKKLVLTGNETSYMSIDASKNIFAIKGVFNQAPELLQVGGFCTHYKYNNVISSLAQNMSNGDFVLNKIADDYSFTIRDNSFSNDTDFKQYVQQQYAAGTPVTVWYVLTEPETGIVNEPLMEIGDYADEVSGISIPVTAGGDTLSVGTTVQPSEVTANYKGWHPVADVHEYDSNYTIATMQALTIAQLQTHTISELQGGEWS